MSLETIRLYNTFLALLSLFALALALGLVVYRLVKGRDAAGFLGGKALWLAWLVSIVATVGSLIYSEVAHFVPCRLCWFQRIAMYPMAVVLLVGAIRQEVAARFYALPLAVIGLAISIWHYVIQVFPSLEGSACDPFNPCSARYVEVFGFISIPFMAGAGFTLISVLLLFYVRANKS
jgi:disulfide bond formation protein DsbB